MSSIVAQYVELAVPSLERVVVVLEQARAAPAEARAGLTAAIERAERDLMPAIQAAMRQGDLFLGDVAKASAPAGDAQAEPGRRQAEGEPKPARRRSGRGSTPVPVTRGSGRPSGVRRGQK